MNSEESIFDAARKLPPGEQRLVLLDSGCGDDAELRRRVERLLIAQDAAGSFLETPAIGVRPSDQLETVRLDSTDDTARSGVVTSPATILPGLEPCDTPGRLGKFGAYEVIELVGQGGMGMVLRAWDTKLHRVVALKLMSAELAANRQAKERFLREARSAAAVVHEHIVSIYTIEDDRQPPLLAMEYIEGETVAQRISREGALPVIEIISLGKQLAIGLAAAHSKGLIHRDIKPANILLEQRTGNVKITDFGLARATDSVELTQSGMILGTPQYMSPEQARGELVDHRSDLFSLGSVLYAMCTGKPAFPSETTVGALHRVCNDAPTPICELCPNIPSWLEAVVGRLLEKGRDDRIQTCGELVEALATERFLRSGTTRNPRARNRYKRLWLAMSIALVVALGLYMVAGRLGQRERTAVNSPTALASQVESSENPTGDGRADSLAGKPPSAAGEQPLSVSAMLTSPDWEWTNPLMISHQVQSPTISGDGLTLIHSTNRSGTHGKNDLFQATRNSRDEPFRDMWLNTRNLGPLLNTQGDEDHPCLLPEGLQLVYVREAENGDPTFWISSRQSVNDPFDIGEMLVVPEKGYALGPHLTASMKTLFFQSTREGGQGDYDLWMARRPTAEGPLDSPVNLGPEVNSPRRDTDPVLSSDGLSLLFSSNRDGSYRLWISTRPAADQPFATPVKLSPTLDLPSDRDLGPSLTEDGRTLVFRTHEIDLKRRRLWFVSRFPKGQKPKEFRSNIVLLRDFVERNELLSAIETDDWSLVEQAAITRLSTASILAPKTARDALMVLAVAKNFGAFRLYSKQVQAQHATNQDFWSCYHTSKSMLLLPLDGPDLAKAVALLERSRDSMQDDIGATNTRELLAFLCLARYRQGKYSEAAALAEPLLEESGLVPTPGNPLYAAAALTHHQLGNSTVAREYLDVLERNFNATDTNSANYAQIRHWMFDKVLLEEARSLIRPGKLILSGLATDEEFFASNQSGDWAALEEAALELLKSDALTGKQHTDALIALGAVGVQPTFEEASRKLLSSYREVVSFQETFNRSRTTLLMPCNKLVTKQAADLLEAAGRNLPNVKSDQRHYYAYFGLARYRKGRYHEAIATISPQLGRDTGSPAKATSLATLAMSAHQLGKDQEAQEAFVSLQQLVSDWENQDPSAEDWRELISAQVLLKETRSLIESPTR